MKLIPKDTANTEGKLYNLTISQNNGATEEKIYKYTLQDGEVVADEDHIDIVYSKSSNGNCIKIIFPCEYGNYHQDGSACVGHGTTTLLMCAGGGPGDTGGDGPGNPPGDGPTTPTGPGGYNPSEGGGGGSTTTNNTPCTKTKALVTNTTTKAVVKDLKDHIISGIGGEKGWKFNKTGVTSQTTNNTDHSVNFGNPFLLNGGYHNHTGTGVNIFSATDISTLIEIARYNGASSPTNAFMGLVVPNGIHYVIRFDGSQASLPPVGNFTPQQLKSWNTQQAILMSTLSRKPEFTEVVNGKKVLNSSGLERILFDTLQKMGLSNKVILQKIESDNSVSTINKNSDGTTTAVPCL